MSLQVSSLSPELDPETPLPRLSGKQLVAVLQSKGFRLAHSHGSHYYFQKPGILAPVMVPVQGSADIPKRTLVFIMRQAKLTPADLHYDPQAAAITDSRNFARRTKYTGCAVALLFPVMIIVGIVLFKMIAGVPLAEDPYTGHAVATTVADAPATWSDELSAARNAAYAVDKGAVLREVVSQPVQDAPPDKAAQADWRSEFRFVGRAGKPIFVALYSSDPSDTALVPAQSDYSVSPPLTDLEAWGRSLLTVRLRANDAADAVQAQALDVLGKQRVRALPVATLDLTHDTARWTVQYTPIDEDLRGSMADLDATTPMFQLDANTGAVLDTTQEAWHIENTRWTKRAP